MEEKEKIERALWKVALGFQVAEVTEEYAEVDGELKLTKRKKTKKDVPPDLKAVQLLLTEGEDGFEQMSDEELQREKERLLSKLSEETKRALAITESEGQVCVEKKSLTKKSTVKKSATKKKVTATTGVKKERKTPSKARKRVIRKKKEGEEDEK